MKKILLIFIPIIFLCACSNEIKTETFLCNYTSISDNFEHNIEMTISYEGENITKVKSITSYTSEDEELKKQFNEILLGYKDITTDDIKYTTEISDNTYKVISTTTINENTIDSFDTSFNGGTLKPLEYKSPIQDDQLNFDLYVEYLEATQFKCEKETN